MDRIPEDINVGGYSGPESKRKDFIQHAEQVRNGTSRALEEARTKGTTWLVKHYEDMLAKNERVISALKKQ